jgi:hypothetical protein
MLKAREYPFYYKGTGPIVPEPPVKFITKTNLYKSTQFDLKTIILSDPVMFLRLLSLSCQMVHRGGFSFPSWNAKKALLGFLSYVPGGVTRPLGETRAAPSVSMAACSDVPLGRGGVLIAS